MIVCPTGKTVYASKPDAERAIRTIRHGHSQRHERPVRAYRCEDGCKLWHVTSSPSDKTARSTA